MTGAVFRLWDVTQNTGWDDYSRSQFLFRLHLAAFHLPLPCTAKPLAAACPAFTCSALQVARDHQCCRHGWSSQGAHLQPKEPTSSPGNPPPAQEAHLQPREPTSSPESPPPDQPSPLPAQGAHLQPSLGHLQPGEPTSSPT